MTSASVSHERHRFPPAIIGHAVWLYFRFPLSLGLVDEMLLEHGIVVSYETGPQSCAAAKFLILSLASALTPRRRRGCDRRAGDAEGLRDG
jgi:transposase-like protein